MNKQLSNREKWGAGCMFLCGEEKALKLLWVKNKKTGEAESFTHRPNLWMLNGKRPKRAWMSQCVCVCERALTDFPKAIYSPARHWGPSGVHTHRVETRPPAVMHNVGNSAPSGIRTNNNEKYKDMSTQIQSCIALIKALISFNSDWNNENEHAQLSL